MVWGKYRGTTMKAKKRGWNGLVKSSKLSQVRESSDLDSYHRKRAASSLVADCTNPQRPPAGLKSWINVAKPLETGCDTHTTSRTRRGYRAVEKRTFFQKPPARLQVMPFLGVELDQCFCRSCWVVGWKSVGVKDMRCSVKPRDTCES